MTAHGGPAEFALVAETPRWSPPNPTRSATFRMSSQAHSLSTGRWEAVGDGFACVVLGRAASAGDDASGAEEDVVAVVAHAGASVPTTPTAGRKATDARHDRTADGWAARRAATRDGSAEKIIAKTNSGREWSARPQGLPQLGTAFSERGGGTTNSTQFSTPAYGLSIIAASSSSTSGHGRLPVAATVEALAPALRSYHPRRLPEVTQRRGVLPLPRVDSGLTDPVVCSGGERRAPCRRGAAVSTVNPRTGLRTVGAWSIPSRRRCHMPRVPQRRRV